MGSEHELDEPKEWRTDDEERYKNSREKLHAFARQVITSEYEGKFDESTLKLINHATRQRQRPRSDRTKSVSANATQEQHGLSYGVQNGDSATKRHLPATSGKTQTQLIL